MFDVPIIKTLTIVIPYIYLEIFTVELYFFHLNPVEIFARRSVSLVQTIGILVMQLLSCSQFYVWLFLIQTMLNS